MLVLAGSSSKTTKMAAAEIQTGGLKTTLHKPVGGVRVDNVTSICNWVQVSHTSHVCKLYSLVFIQSVVEAVWGSEHPEAADDRPTAVVPGLDLDADLPGPSPLRSLPAPHYTGRSGGADQGPLPTASQTQ